jgi:hypothetical protein
MCSSNVGSKEFVKHFPNANREPLTSTARTISKIDFSKVTWKYVNDGLL